MGILYYLLGKSYVTFEFPDWETTPEEGLPEVPVDFTYSCEGWSFCSMVDVENANSIRIFETDPKLIGYYDDVYVRGRATNFYPETNYFDAYQEVYIYDAWVPPIDDIYVVVGWNTVDQRMPDFVLDPVETGF